MKLIYDWKNLHKKYSVIATCVNILLSVFQLVMVTVYSRQISMHWYIFMTIFIGMASIALRAVSQGPEDGNR